MLLLATAGGADTLLLQPGTEGVDTFILDSYSSNNFGNEAVMSAGILTNEWRALIIWDLSALPEGAEITSAEMGLYCFDTQGEPTGLLGFYLITDEWNEQTVTWNNQPEYDADEVLTFDWPWQGQVHYFDVTEFVTGWYSAEYDNHGLIGIGSVPGHAASFYTSDYEQAHDRPSLTIEYTPSDTGAVPTSLGTVKAAYR
jgi:hypothetical protein